MSTANGAHHPSTTPPPPAPPSSEPSEFIARRAALLADIGDSLETVLQQMNSLNRSLEGIITIGNEFSAVESLWSQFEGVMGKDDEGIRKDADGEEKDKGREKVEENSGSSS